MGANGVGAFDSETGRAWLRDRYQPNGAAAVEAVLSAVNGMGGADTLAAREATEAFAAAEVVAAAHGEAANGLDGADREAVMSHAGAVRGLDGILHAASGAVARLGADTSELNTIRNESDDADNWQSALIDLSNRLDRAERNQP